VLAGSAAVVVRAVVGPSTPTGGGRPAIPAVGHELRRRLDKRIGSSGDLAFRLHDDELARIAALSQPRSRPATS
jgi:hypothetical protein